MKTINALLLFLLFGLMVVSCDQKRKVDAYGLWYKQEAQTWVEALPVGNGRLGAMIYGGVQEEHIQFNEETLWTGQPHDYANPGSKQYLEDIRQLLWEGKQAEAQDLANEHFMSQPFGQLCYQPFGDVYLNFSDHEVVENYERRLSLQEAVTTVQYDCQGVHYQREVFASAPDQTILIRLSASQTGALSFQLRLESSHEQTEIKTENGEEIVLIGKSNNYPQALDYLGNPYPESKVTFEARLKVIECDGTIEPDGELLQIKGAQTVTLALVGATNFVNYKDLSGDPEKRCLAYLKKLEGKSYEALKRDHIEDYQSLYGRLNIDLGESPISSRPTNERLDSFYEDQDPNLVALLYQYGRYLLISSSRPGTQPANLQGIWNDRMKPPWDSKYTININTEMNYWLAEMTNLSECAEPLIRMVEDLSVTGRNVAREHYGLDGWVTHHNTDIWRGAAPINHANHGIWVTGGAWLTQHVWWHYQFTQDKEFLKNRAYPVMKEAAVFFMDYLMPYPQQPAWLVSGPSNSPENGGLVMGPTMDHQIIRNVMNNTIEAANILQVDNDFATELKQVVEKIAPNQIGQHGQLQEWLDDVDEPGNKHRHVSHLWGLHPGNEIHPSTTPQLADACKVTLVHRGDGGTGWSRAWKVNFWARLLDGDHAFLLLKNLMVPVGRKVLEEDNRGGLYPNLFDAHPPFQIDGNFGATSGITEMILQSHLRDEDGHFILDILPALPKALPNGVISGLCARGGFELSIKWENSQLKELELFSKYGKSCTIKYGNKSIQLNTEEDQKCRFDVDLNAL
jgi:alpha-L-fucosidase 2